MASLLTHKKIAVVLDAIVITAAIAVASGYLQLKVTPVSQTSPNLALQVQLPFSN